MIQDTMVWRHSPLPISAMVVLLTLFAAEDVRAQDGDTIEEVVVTGSLIQREVSRGSNMITSFDQSVIESSGALNAVELVNLFPQNQAIEVTNTSVGEGTGFASFANLRSLGSQNTLILLGSRRVANSPFTTRAVDLNTIPLHLIERVETLPDGASAIYGSDAVAGVINFIPLRQFQGIAVEAQGDFPTAEGGGQEFKVSGSIGFGDLESQGYNAYIGVSYRDQNDLDAIDRAFARTNYIPERGLDRTQNRPFPGDYIYRTTGGATAAVNPSAVFGCSPPETITASGAGTGCFFDFAAVVDAIVPQEDVSVIGAVSKHWGDVRFRTEFYWTESQALSTIAPNNLIGLFSLQPTSPYYPGNGVIPAPSDIDSTQPVTVNFASQPVGPFVLEATNGTNRVLAEVEWRAMDMDFSAWLLRSGGTSELAFENGIVARSVWNQLFDPTAPVDEQFNPFSVTQTPQVYAILEAGQILGVVQEARGTLWMGGIQGSADLFDLAGGTVRTALAIDVRDDEVKFRTDPIAADAVRTGIAPGDDRQGSRNAYSVTWETLAPISTDIDLNVALRFDDYDDVGDTFNPKVQLVYEPMDAVVFRGTYSTGFRAPTLDDINRPTSIGIGIGRFDDPNFCDANGNPINGGNAADCNRLISQRTGGNENLKPEESRVFAFGITVQPVSEIDLQFGIDYWNYEVTGKVGALGVDTILRDPQFANLIRNCGEAAAVGVDLSLDAACDDVNDPSIGLVDIRQINLGETRTSGFDFTVNFQSTETKVGYFSVDYRGTSVSKFEFERIPGADYFDRLGRYSAQTETPVFEYQHYLRLGWHSGEWNVFLSNSYDSSYDDCNAFCGIAEEFHQDVDAYSLWNLAVTYQPSDSLTLVARVDNLADEDPPFTNKTSGLASGYDERYTNPLGRVIGIAARYQFKL